MYVFERERETEREREREKCVNEYMCCRQKHIQRGTVTVSVESCFASQKTFLRDLQ